MRNKDCIHTCPDLIPCREEAHSPADNTHVQPRHEVMVKDEILHTNGTIINPQTETR